jgi:hypothetical protein
MMFNVVLIIADPESPEETMTGGIEKLTRFCGCGMVGDGELNFSAHKKNTFCS